MAEPITLTLAVIPEPTPWSRSVIDIDGNGPAGLDGGLIDAVCGNCGTLLWARMEINQVANVVVRCGVCRVYNESNVYELARGGLRFLIAEGTTVEQLCQLLDALKENREDPEALVSEEQPDLVRRLAALLPQTRSDAYSVIAILISLLTLWLGRPSTGGSTPAPPTDSQVQQIINDTLKDEGLLLARDAEPTGAQRIGRNEPCWCGSGKKYKRCHGDTASQ
jgi:hypothetical protein